MVSHLSTHLDRETIQPFVNEMSMFGRTTVHIAACSGNAVMMETLLQCGADATICDLNGKPPQYTSR